MLTRFNTSQRRVTTICDSDAIFGSYGLTFRNENGVVTVSGNPNFSGSYRVIDEAISNTRLSITR